VTGTGYGPEGTFRLDGQHADPAADPDLLTALRVAALANRADAVLAGEDWVARGDPTEAALISGARKAGIDRAVLLRQSREVGEVPFSSARQFMAIFCAGTRHTPVTAFVKGAPHVVLDRCARVSIDGDAYPLDPGQAHAWSETNRAMASRGLRVLALAYGTVSGTEESALTGLTLVGLAGISDPPADGVRAAVDAFRTAGIRTTMITGDQRGTALAIARDLGIADAGRTLEGREIDGLSDQQLQEQISRVGIFCRVSPEAKLRIVAAYQRAGEVVAMIGDGVNDAAALKKADVGVTMGRRGTDVARETAAVVLQDDRFDTIGVAIAEGRVVFDNIQKFVFYLFSCNLGEILVILGASTVGLPLPLFPIQVLWLNLVTDTLPALALAVEPAEADVMGRPPRNPREGILPRRFLLSIVGYGGLIAASVFVVIGYARLMDLPEDQAMTMRFMALALAQAWHVGNARDRRPVIRPRRVVANPWALGAVAIVALLQVMTVVVPPLASVLRVVPLDALEWAVVLMASAVPAIVGQAWKAYRVPAIG
jgi:Ca2+-transporting ATPase